MNFNKNLYIIARWDFFLNEHLDLVSTASIAFLPFYVFVKILFSVLTTITTKYEKKKKAELRTKTSNTIVYYKELNQH